MTGFSYEVNFIIKDHLLGGSNDLTAIAIVGMPGLGKTTFIKTVFNDRQLGCAFFPRIWIEVSRSTNTRPIFMNILSNFTKQTDDYRSMPEEELASIICELLEGDKYLIVIDDVWSESGWDSLRIALFSRKQKQGSRILVTTRDSHVAMHVDSFGSPFKLRSLMDDESWELLCKKVFGKENCPPYLVPMGRRIARKCNGLPLAIVLVSGILIGKESSIAAIWEKVDEDWFPKMDMLNQSYDELVKLCYSQLPNHTKYCFLYLAAFPMGHEISTWKLIHLWIAEGFIPPSPNLEGTTETYLNDFVNRNLLMVLKRRANGEIKMCHLGDVMLGFCKREAKNINLLHDGIDEVRIDTRRLCINSSVMRFVASDNMLFGEHIRSLLTSSSSSSKTEIPKKHLATIPKSYPLLKVFEADESLNFFMLPKEFYQLYHLRYLAISTEHNIIPKLLGDLWNLQNLVFNTLSQSRIDVKAEIWNMPKLRHILANASLELPPPSESCQNNSSCPELQTLSTMSTKSCTEEIFDKTLNLLKLGVRGNLAELLESKNGICLFDNIQKLHKLENLKLVHDAINYQASIIPSFPRADKFPRNLRKLTLSNTSFVWKDICVLGSLDELEVLKLEEFAAKGHSWETNKVVFKRLRFLRIGRTNLVHWTYDVCSFPVLECVYLLHCTDLDSVSLAFKDVQSLKVMELFYTNKNAATSARYIEEQKPKMFGFKLSIHPPYHP